MYYSSHDKKKSNKYNFFSDQAPSNLFDYNSKKEISICRLETSILEKLDNLIPLV